MIPKVIEKYLEEVGLNTANLLSVPDREIYDLNLVDSDGSVVPTGLPFLVEVKGDSVKRLSETESFNILEKYGSE